MCNCQGLCAKSGQTDENFNNEARAACTAANYRNSSGEFKYEVHDSVNGWAKS